MLSSVPNIETDNLAQLALRAATELDRFERKGVQDLNAVSEFVDALSTLSSTRDDISQAALFMDPISSEMLSEAVRSTTENPIYSVDQLSDELFKVTSEMSNLSKDGNHEFALQKLKAFCLLIHDFVQRNRITGGLTEKGVFDYDHNYAG